MRGIACVSCALLLLGSFSPARAEEPSRLIRFADSLFSSGEYYRAVTEYLRFREYFPAEAEAPRALFMIGKCYASGERWGDARQWLERFADEYPSDPRVPESILLAAESYAREGRGGEAVAYLRRKRNRIGPEKAGQSYWLEAGALIGEGKWEEARDILVKAGDAPAYRERALDLAGALDGARSLSRKSPTAAGLLSAVLPGAGQLYVERPKDAFWAFALNSAFIWAMIRSFETDNQATGYVLAFFELGWYTGNIYNAVNQANRYNRRAVDGFRDGLKRRGGWEFGLAPTVSGAALVARVRW